MSAKRSATAIGLWLALLAACAGWLGQRLLVTTDMSAFLPPAATQAQELLIGQMRSGVASRLLLLALEGASQGELASASAKMAHKLRDDPGIQNVANGEPVRAADLQQVFAARYVLSPGVTPGRFSPEGLRAALQESLALLASPMGAELRQWLAPDPTGEMRRIAELFAPRESPPLHDGVWVTGDGKRALLLVETRAPGWDIDAQDKAIAGIRKAFAESAPASARLLIAGPGLAAVTGRSTVERDAGRSSLIATLGILAILLLAYRSPWPVLFSALPAASGLVAGITAVSLWFGPVHGITIGFAAILIGEAVDYPTYLFAQAGRGEALESTLARIGATLRLAVLTTACGALSMLLSSFHGLSQLGLLTITGVVVAGLVTRWVLPALTPPRILERKLVRLPLGHIPGPPPARYAWPAVALLAVAAAAVVLQKERLWDDDLSRLAPLPEDIRSLDRELRAQLGAPDPRHLVIATAPDREQVLEKSERIAAALDGAVKSGAIAGYDLAARFVPSRKTQETRRAALPDAQTLAANLAQAQAGLPFRPGLFEPFLADVARARQQPLLAPESLQGALRARVDSLLVRNGKDWAALVPVAGVRDAATLSAALGKSGETGVLLLDLKHEADSLVAGYRAEALRLLGIGLACIALLVFAGLRSLAATARVLAPVLAATLMVVAALALAGVQLTLFHLVALLLVVGVGTNYALFFNQPRPPAGEERALMLLSLAVASLATLISASTLAFSSTPVLRAIGLTAAVGTVFALVLSALLAPRTTR
jgi:predicted exporter